MTHNEYHPKHAEEHCDHCLADTHAHHDADGCCHHHSANGISPRKMFIVTALNIIITLAELSGGIISGSLALLSDALHNFSDAISLVISYLAIKIAGKASDTKKTFGYKRAEVVAAFVNAAVLAGICCYLVIEAIKRFFHPEPVMGLLMLTVAFVGLVANLISVLLLHKSAKQSMNIRSSYLHLLGDTISSVGVVLGGVAIYYWHVYWLDPLITVLVALYIFKESLFIMKNATNIMMQGAPRLDYLTLKKDVENITGVKNIHHLHAWYLNEQKTHFEAHIDVKDMQVSQTQTISGEINSLLKEKYGFSHVTLQFECDLCADKSMLHCKI